MHLSSLRRACAAGTEHRIVRTTVQGIIQVHRIRQRHMTVIMMAAQEPMIIHGKKETPKGKNHPEK